MKLNEYIQQARKSIGISARELSRRTGISQAYLSQLETGKHTNPSNELLEKMAAALEVDYSTLWLMRDGGYAFEDHDLSRALIAYLSVGDEESFITGQEAQFKIEKLFDKDVPLTYNSHLLSDEEKEKILSIIDTILK